MTIYGEIKGGGKTIYFAFRFLDVYLQKYINPFDFNTMRSFMLVFFKKKTNIKERMAEV